MILSEINIYPVKSLKGISLKEAKIERRGLQFDRRWMLVDEKNKFFTQREFPRMATIKVEIRENNLRVSQNGSLLEIPFTPPGDETARVQVWRSKCAARVYDDLINKWFSGVLQTKCKLVLM